MAFTKTNNYYEYKLQNIKRAISATKNEIANATEQRQIDAQTSYLTSCEKELEKTENDYKGFQND